MHRKLLRAMRLLVTGLIPHDAGKTWFVIALAKYLEERGFRVAVYKPVAAHNLWYQRYSLAYTLKFRVLIGEDVSSYLMNLRLDQSIAEINPVAMAISVPCFRSVKEIDDYLQNFENQFQTLVLARFSNCETGIHAHYIVEDNLKNVPLTIRLLVEELAKKLNAEPTNLDAVLNKIMSMETANYLNKCLDKVSEGRDIVIVESFNDAIEPFAGALRSVDKVVIISPGYLFIVRDLDTLRKAFEKAIREHGVEGARTSTVLKYLEEDLIEVIDLSFRTTPTLVDEISKKVFKHIIR